MRYDWLHNLFNVDFNHCNCVDFYRNGSEPKGGGLSSTFGGVEVLP